MAVDARAVRAAADAAAATEPYNNTSERVLFCVWDVGAGEPFPSQTAVDPYLWMERLAMTFDCFCVIAATNAAAVAVAIARDRYMWIDKADENKPE